MNQGALPVASVAVDLAREGVRHVCRQDRAGDRAPARWATCEILQHLKALNPARSPLRTSTPTASRGPPLPAGMPRPSRSTTAGPGAVCAHRGPSWWSAPPRPPQPVVGFDQYVRVQGRRPSQPGCCSILFIAIPRDFFHPQDRSGPGLNQVTLYPRRRHWRAQRLISTAGGGKRGVDRSPSHHRT